MKLGYIHRYHRHIAILSVTFCPTKKYTEPHNLPLFKRTTKHPAPKGTGCSYYELNKQATGQNISLPKLISNSSVSAIRRSYSSLLPTTTLRNSGKPVPAGIR